jgi:hypothetical protein
LTCDPFKGCPPDTHNLHCGYPDCAKGTNDKRLRDQNRVRVSQGPAAAPHPHHLGHLLEGRHPGSVTRVLKGFTANGNLADYDDELANRVHDAVEIVEKAPTLADTLVWVSKNASDPNLTAHVRGVLERLQIDPLRWKSEETG